jgi:ornithine carbamoyltransferase
MTIKERFGFTRGLKIAYVGDANNNMANSYLVACAMAGMSVAVSAPEGYLPNQSVIETAKRYAAEFDQQILVTTDAKLAVSGADVVATDTWVSMGMEAEAQKRQQLFADYSVTEELFAQAKPEAVFLHCLPAYRGFEVSAEVIDGPRSLVWQEAENRLHAQKALMVFLARHR